MLAHVKRIGMAQVTVAPFFQDFHGLRINRQLCILQEALDGPYYLLSRIILLSLPILTCFY
jgi:hypothetical protein